MKSSFRIANYAIVYIKYLPCKDGSKVSKYWLKLLIPRGLAAIIKKKLLVTKIINFGLTDFL